MFAEYQIGVLTVLKCIRVIALPLEYYECSVGVVIPWDGFYNEKHSVGARLPLCNRVPGVWTGSEICYPIPQDTRTMLDGLGINSNPLV